MIDTYWLVTILTFTYFGLWAVGLALLWYLGLTPGSDSASSTVSVRTSLSQPTT